MSRLLKYLNEKYIKFRGKSYEVLENPNPREIRDLKTPYLKFIADRRDKTLYVWDIDGPLHESAWRQIKGGSNLKMDIYKGYILSGYSTLNRGPKPVMDSGDGNYYLQDYLQNGDITLEQFKNNFKWVDKYIDISAYLGESSILSEKFFERGKFSNNSIEIFVNPTRKEMNSIGSKELRFTADCSNKKVYVFDGRRVLHVEVWGAYKEINKGRDFQESSKDGVLFGVCEPIGGKWVMTSSDEIELEERLHQGSWDFTDMLIDFKWVNRYINVDKFLREYL